MENQKIWFFNSVAFKVWYTEKTNSIQIKTYSIEKWERLMESPFKFKKIHFKNVTKKNYVKIHINNLKILYLVRHTSDGICFWGLKLEKYK
jgi:hypothetical protein